MSTKPLIHIVDDDEAMRDSLAWLLDGDRYAVHTYTSGEDFLERHAPGRPACVILDIRMQIAARHDGAVPFDLQTAEW